jgi:hypothetical protein
MYDTAIQRLVCQAVVSDRFRARLLGSDRAEVLRASGLGAVEQKELLSIPADTLEEFAAGIERMMRQGKPAGDRPDVGESVAIRGLLAVEIPPRTG